MNALVEDWSLPAGVVVTVLLVAVVMGREVLRIRTGRPGGRAHTAAGLVLAAMFVAIVVGRFAVLA